MPKDNKPKMGRPMKYATADELQYAVDDYFNSLNGVDSEGNQVCKRPTLSGLAYHLDVDTATLRNYAKKNDFFRIIRRARQLVEVALEERLYDNAPTGAIFNLKCNFQYRDNDDASKVQEAEPISPVFTVAQPKSDIKVTNGAE